MRLLLLALLAASLCGAQPAFAQALPDTVRSAGVTVAQWRAVQAEVRRAAAARGASERALAAVAQRVSANYVVNGRVDLDQVLASIDERAQQVAELQGQLAAMQQADDPAVAALLSQARAAIEAGDLTRGDQLLEQAAQSDLAGIARVQAQLEPRQTRAAQTIAERGRLAYASADYIRAAALYAQAADTAPQADPRGRWLYRMFQTDALYQRGRLFGEPAPVREAVRLYRDVALPLAPRAQRPADWGATQHDLGGALWVLGGFGDDAALREAIVAYRAALQARTRASAPADWAMTQNNLGAALQLLGERGDNTALREAIAAYRAALEVHTRAAAPAQWAMTQNNLGNALRVLGQRGDDRALREAIVAFRAALEVRTRASAPADWAQTQNNLGNALWVLGVRGNDAALHEGIAAYRAVLEVSTRTGAPAQWAQTQNDLGLALTTLGERGDDVALREAIAAYRAALQVRTRAAAPADWAKTQFNLGLAYRAATLRGDRSQLGVALAAARAALDGFEQVGDQYFARQARVLIADLESR
jgi:tetratricopeptide (TPR) repeat protein